jgi:hypothetical protein
VGLQRMIEILDRQMNKIMIENLETQTNLLNDDWISKTSC